MPEIIDPLTASQRPPSPMPPEPVLAPRLKHNRDMAIAYLKANKVYSRYPKITDQIETVPLDTAKLFPFGYNPAIIEHDGKVLMAYRYHADRTLATKLAMCELKDGSPVDNATLELIGKSVEDPKLFRLDNSCAVSFVESTWPERPPKSRVGITDLATSSWHFPAIGKNDLTAVEKNWVFFQHESSLYCIYQCSPTQKVYLNPVDQEWREVFETPAIRWPYGPIHGGTPPLPYEGKWIRFFHSSLDNELNPQPRRYYMGALLMEPEPPFQTVAVSKKPILYGSEVDNLTGDQRRSCQQHKPQVVFPGGAIEREGGWWVSLGCNDSACVLAKVKPEQLNL